MLRIESKSACATFSTLTAAAAAAATAAATAEAAAAATAAATAAAAGKTWASLLHNRRRSFRHFANFFVLKTFGAPYFF